MKKSELKVIATGLYMMPDHIWHNGSVNDLLAMGLKPTGKVGDYQVSEYELPEGWCIAESGLSYFQRILVDNVGRVRARLFYKPGSQAGRPEMLIENLEARTVFLPDTVWHGKQIGELVERGLRPTGAVGELQTSEYALPPGWDLVASEESPLQYRLVDGNGGLHAKVFYKPGSLVGRPEMELMSL
jgi:hypothetical protein